jgi:hypothetical protein
MQKKTQETTNQARLNSFLYNGKRSPLMKRTRAHYYPENISSKTGSDQRKVYKKIYLSTWISRDISADLKLESAVTVFWIQPFKTGLFGMAYQIPLKLEGLFNYIQPGCDFEGKCYGEGLAKNNKDLLPDEVSSTSLIKLLEETAVKPLSKRVQNQYPVYNGVNPLSEDEKKLIVSEVGSGDIIEIEAYMRMNFPGVDFEDFTWGQIIYAIKSKAGKAGAAAIGAGVAEKQAESWHNDQYTWIKLDGAEYSLNRTQGRVIEYIKKNKVADVAAIQELIDSSANKFRLDTLFRDDEAKAVYEKLIEPIPNRKGFYRLKKI